MTTNSVSPQCCASWENLTTFAFLFRIPAHKNSYYICASKQVNCGTHDLLIICRVKGVKFRNGIVFFLYILFFCSFFITGKHVLFWYLYVYVMYLSFRRKWVLGTLAIIYFEKMNYY